MMWMRWAKKPAEFPLDSRPQRSNPRSDTPDLTNIPGGIIFQIIRQKHKHIEAGLIQKKYICKNGFVDCR